MDNTEKKVENYEKYMVFMAGTAECIRMEVFPWVSIMHNTPMFNLGTQENPKPIKDLVGVLLDVKPFRKHKQGCLAHDGHVGSLYGRCAECPYSVWIDNKKPECTEYRTVLFQRAGEATPEQIRIPSTSFKPLFKYISNLLTGKTLGTPAPTFAVVTKLTLSSLKGDNNSTYSILNLEMVRPVKDIGAVANCFTENVQSFRLPLLSEKALLPAPALAPVVAPAPVVAEEDPLPTPATKKKKATSSKAEEPPIEITDTEVIDALEDTDIYDIDI